MNAFFPHHWVEDRDLSFFEYGMGLLCLSLIPALPWNMEF
jgi:hypothetical protein